MRNHLKLLGFALCCAVMSPVAVAALPGQSRAVVCAWAEHSAALSDVQCESGSEGEIAYISGRIRKPSWSDRLFFESHPDETGKIAVEKIAYTHFPNVEGVYFKQTASNGLNLVRTFYGEMANDFSSAAHVSDIQKHHIYRGKRFIYEIVSHAYTDTAQTVAREHIIENDFLIFPHGALKAAQNYARSDRGGM